MKEQSPITLYVRGVTLGDRLDKYGGCCRQASDLTQIFITGLLGIPTYAMKFRPAPGQTSIGHLFVETQDGYIIDASIGFAFRIEYDVNGRVILPQNVIEGLKNDRFADDPAKASLVIHNTLDAIQVAVPDPTVIAYSPTFVEKWKSVGFAVVH